jgi:hypothetical protein
MDLRLLLFVADSSPPDAADFQRQLRPAPSRSAAVFEQLSQELLQRRVPLQLKSEHAAEAA